MFFDNLKEAEEACKSFCARLPEGSGLRDKVRYFHSTMSTNYREGNFMAMQNGEIWILFCTDAFGMVCQSAQLVIARFGLTILIHKGMDIGDIAIVIQWKAMCDLSTLWQRFGRVARASGRTGTAILLVEKKDTEEERLEKERKLEEKKRRAEEKKKKAEEKKRFEEEGKENKGAAPRQPGKVPKRNLPSPSESGRPAKRQALGDRGSNGESTPAEATSDPPTNDSERQPSTRSLTAGAIAERRSRYTRALETRANTSKRFQSKGVEIGSAMDDFINSHMRHECRTLAPDVYFGNDKARK